MDVRQANNTGPTGSSGSMNQTISILGGAKALGLKQSTPRHWIYLIRKGFPTATLIAFTSRTGMTNIELAQILGVSVRVLASRRSRKTSLSSYESERLLRAAKVIARAHEAFGNFAKGLAWLRAAKTSFAGATPISFIDTEPGTELVLGLLDRIDHGFFA